MKYKEINDLLPREIPSELKPILDFFSKTIDNAVNFGTNLIKWDIERKLVGDEHLAPIMFFRNILEITDGISILIKNSSIDTCHTLQRSLIENILALKYLLETEDTFKNRSLSYMVWLTHKDLKICEKFDETTQSGKQLKNELLKDELIGDNHSIKKTEQFDILKKNSIELLELPIYKSIDTEYVRTNGIKKNPNWYTLYDGPKNIEGLAKHLKMHATYEIYYRYLSGKVHATSVLKKKIVQDKDTNMASIIQIRDYDDVQLATHNALIFILMAIIEYKKRVPEKSTDFKNWYEEFRIPFKEIGNRNFLNVIK
ncbi:MAG TPA: hypothetical protein EYG92_11280 [Lutibacter sp.]|nr:hypothetical protein [Lutibacter sp.]